MKIDDIKSRLKSALKTLSQNDKHLFDINAHEQTITHRLAVYLEGLFIGYDVDCEYNRKEEDPKKINDKLIKPDIIVHRRGKGNCENYDNLLAIEVKKNWDSEEDRVKLEGLTIEDGGYEYQLGCFLVLNKDNQKNHFVDTEKSKFFIDGKEEKFNLFPINP